MGSGGLQGVSHGAHVLFKGASLVNGKVASSGLAGVDAVKASYGAVTQEARMFLDIRTFLGVFSGNVSRASTDVTAGVFGGPLAVSCQV